MNKITKIVAEEIKDSRGNPAIKVTVFAGEISGSFAVPSGASTGAHEAHELRDPDGKGVKNAIEKVNKIITPALLGKDIFNQKEIDKVMIELDGTPNKDKLGGNSIIGVSIASARAAAKIKEMEVFEYLRTLAEMKPSRKTPYLYMNLINGGKHVPLRQGSEGQAKNGLAFQEYHVVPDTEDPAEAVEIGIKIQNDLKKIISEELGEESTALGDEGGFAPKVDDIKKPLQFLTKVIKENDLEKRVWLALDVAASSFYQGGEYKVGGKEISKEELMEIHGLLARDFNILSIEDPFDEEDFESFRKLKERSGGLVVVGDDLTATNQELLKKAIAKGSIGAMIIKPNQIGTLSETLKTMQLARENGIELIVSHRSGETNDDFIADLAFAFNCFGMKAGAPFPPERMVKYKRLIEISQR